MQGLFTHPLFLLPAALLALLALALGLRSQLFPGVGVTVSGQRPFLQGLGLALLVAGAGLGLAEPRGGLPEAPRLTVHVLLDASRSMGVPDVDGATRWQAALALLDRLWTQSNPGVRFSLDLLTGDAVPILPPGEDRQLLQDVLRAIQPGEVGSPGTSMARGIAQVAAQAQPKAPAILFLVGDGEETWEAPALALSQASTFLREAKLPLYAYALGAPQRQPVPLSVPAGAQGGQELFSQAQPDFLRQLAQASGGRLLAPGENPGELFQKLAQGQEPLPLARSTLPAHPEWGAWVALGGLALWLAAAGKPMRSWRPFLGLVLAAGAGLPTRAALPWPQSIQAWRAQSALDAGDLATARLCKPRGGEPLQRLLAAEIELRSLECQAALTTLGPLIGQGSPRPVPVWRAPALLLAAQAWVGLKRPEEARTLLERLLVEQPGRPEAIHNLQVLLKDPDPPRNPRKPPPPPPKPSQGALQDELEGLKQRLPRNPHPPGGVKDL